MRRARLPEIVLGALTGLAVLSASPVHAATTAPLEGEALSVLSGTSTTYADAAASGGGARALWSNGALVGSVPSAGADRLVLRLRGNQYQGAPSVVVHVDGVRVATLSVPSSTWAEYVVAGSWTAAAHRVQLSYTNDLYAKGVGDRNLHVDRIGFRTAQSQTPTPAPTPTPTPTPAPTMPTPAPPPTPLDDAYESRIVELVNLERARLGLRPLAVSSCADRFAEEWSASMASSGQFAHRSDLGAVMRACSARGVGENIAYGTVTADQMMAMWMGSAGHRANILNAAYTHIGVGAATTPSGRTYGTQNFLTV